jgi:hypothetical protein
MPPFESKSARRASNPIDWQGWAALIWMLIAGFLYTGMVVKERGGKAAEILSGITCRAGDAIGSSFRATARKAICDRLDAGRPSRR